MIERARATLSEDLLERPYEIQETCIFPTSRWFRLHAWQLSQERLAETLNWVVLDCKSCLWFGRHFTHPSPPQPRGLTRPRKCLCCRGARVPGRSRNIGRFRHDKSPTGSLELHGKLDISDSSGNSFFPTDPIQTWVSIYREDTDSASDPNSPKPMGWETLGDLMAFNHQGASVERRLHKKRNGLTHFEGRGFEFSHKVSRGQCTTETKRTITQVEEASFGVHLAGRRRCNPRSRLLPLASSAIAQGSTFRGNSKLRLSRDLHYAAGLIVGQQTSECVFFMKGHCVEQAADSVGVASKSTGCERVQGRSRQTGEC